MNPLWVSAAADVVLAATVPVSVVVFLIHSARRRAKKQKDRQRLEAVAATVIVTAAGKLLGIDDLLEKIKAK